MIHRIYRTCSSWRLFHKAIEEAKVILLNNQYPQSFVDDLIYITMNKIMNVQDIHTNDDNDTNIDLDDSKSDILSIDCNGYLSKC